MCEFGRALSTSPPPHTWREWVYWWNIKKLSGGGTEWLNWRITGAQTRFAIDSWLQNITEKYMSKTSTLCCLPSFISQGSLFTMFHLQIPLFLMLILTQGQCSTHRQQQLWQRFFQSSSGTAARQHPHITQIGGQIQGQNTSWHVVAPKMFVFLNLTLFSRPSDYPWLTTTWSFERWWNKLWNWRLWDESNIPWI